MSKASKSSIYQSRDSYQIYQTLAIIEEMLRLLFTIAKKSNSDGSVFYWGTVSDVFTMKAIKGHQVPEHQGFAQVE